MLHGLMSTQYRHEARPGLQSTPPSPSPHPKDSQSLIPGTPSTVGPPILALLWDSPRHLSSRRGWAGKPRRGGASEEQTRVCEQRSTLPRERVLMRAGLGENESISASSTGPISRAAEPRGRVQGGQPPRPRHRCSLLPPGAPGPSPGSKPQARHTGSWPSGLASPPPLKSRPD